MDLEKASAKLEDEEIGVSENSSRCGRLRSLSRKGKCGLCCAVFAFVSLTFTTAFWVSMFVANDGSQCSLPETYEAATWEAWEASGTLPNLTFLNCSDSNGSMPLSMLRLFGYHNSYKKPSEPAPEVAGLNRVVPAWHYGHPTTKEQLEVGRRTFEWDIHFGDDRKRVMSYHLPVLDDSSDCFCFGDCLKTLKTWSDENPNHLPVIIYIEVKGGGGSLFEDTRIYRDPTTQENLLGVDQLIRSIFVNRSQVLVPEDLIRGSGVPTLREAVTTRGWPTVQSLRGKVIFMLMETTGPDSQDQYHKELYLDGPAFNVSQRVMFLMDSFVLEKPDLDSDHIAVLKQDTFKDTKLLEKAAEKVREGFLIRTRGAEGETSLEESIQDMEESGAIEAGSQIISLEPNHVQVIQQTFSSNGVGACGFAPNICPSHPCQAADLQE